MIKIEEFVPESEVAILRQALYAEACFNGFILGSIVRHDDDDLTIDFTYAEYEDGDMVEDLDVVDQLGYILSENHSEHMYDLAEKYPDIINADLIITFGGGTL